MEPVTDALLDRMVQAIVDEVDPEQVILFGSRGHGAIEVKSMHSKAICRNPDILGGTPVFSGTRVPVRILIEHLEAGDRIDDFLDSYPTVSREQAIAVLEVAKTALTGKPDEAAA